MDTPQSSKELQTVSIGADTNLFPFVEFRDRLGQDTPDVVVAIASQQDRRGEFFVLSNTLALDHIYDDVCALPRVPKLVVVIG